MLRVSSSRRRAETRAQAHDTPRPRRRRRAHLAQQQRADALDGERDGAIRLGHEIHRAEFERAQRHRRPGLGEGGDHDDARRAVGLHQLLEAGDAVQLGHVHIERHDIGQEGLRLFQRLAPVAREGQGEVALRLEDLAHVLAHQRAVIHD